MNEDDEIRRGVNVFTHWLDPVENACFCYVAWCACRNKGYRARTTPVLKKVDCPVCLEYAATAPQGKSPAHPTQGASRTT